jgi:hypothetical protein
VTPGSSDPIAAANNNTTREKETQEPQTQVSKKRQNANQRHWKPLRGKE